jgi:hypothetical protein
VNKRLRPSKNIPKVGDLIGCNDNDFGIVVRTYRMPGDDNLMVAVKWHSGRVLTDPWNAQDYCTADDMFWIMSRI